MKKIHKRFQKQFLSELNTKDVNTKLKHVIGIKKTTPKSLKLKPYLLVSLSFVFTLFIVLVLFNNDLNPFTSGAPRYLGMDVSSDDDMTVSSSSSRGIRRLSISRLSSDTNPIQDYLDGLSIITRDDIIYYGKANEKVIITIYLDNPNQYEILSFTINDRLYQSFEFLAQSNSNQLLISFDLPITPGVSSIKINAIKYVVDTSIRNVIMSGEQTIRVGVSYEVLPTLDTYNIITTKDTFSFTYDIKDISNLISNTLEVIVYDGIEIKRYPLNALSDTFQLNNLKVGFKYVFALVSVFDPIDGLGRRSFVLLNNTFETLHDLTTSNEVITTDSIAFDINSTLGNVSFISTLYLEDAEITSSTSSNVLFENLLSNTTYDVVISYTYIINSVTLSTSIRLTYQTLKLDTPYVEMMSLISFNKILFSEYIVFDPDNVLTLTSFDIYHDNTYLTSILGPFTYTIDPLDPSIKKGSFQLAIDLIGTYKVVATYSYNLNDGNGEVTINSTDPSLKHVLSLLVE